MKDCIPPPSSMHLLSQHCPPKSRCHSASFLVQERSSSSSQWMNSALLQSTCNFRSREGLGTASKLGRMKLGTSPVLSVVTQKCSHNCYTFPSPQQGLHSGEPYRSSLQIKELTPLWNLLPWFLTFADLTRVLDSLCAYDSCWYKTEQEGQTQSWQMQVRNQ